MTHAFYAQPGPITSTGAHDLSRAPKHPADIARMIQGLVIHEFMAPAYGVTVSAERVNESHIRHVAEMLDGIFALDPSPLTVARPPEKRLVGVCHHFSLLFVAMMREHGMPVHWTSRVTDSSSPATPGSNVARAGRTPRTSGSSAATCAVSGSSLAR